MISRQVGKFVFLTGCILLMFPRVQCAKKDNDTDTRPGSMERELLNYLLDKYRFPQRNLALPSDPGGGPLEVELGLILLQLMDVNEKGQIVTINAWMNLKWTDPSLAWNETEYKEIAAVRIPPSRIWRPDILMYNSADDRFDATYHTNVLVYSNGVCSWMPPGLLKSTCTIDVSFFPFDQQRCDIKFSSWTYDGASLNLIPMLNGNDTDGFQENGEWELLGMPVERHVITYVCCPDAPYPDVTFYLELRRRSLYYSINILIPCVLLATLTLLGFTLPPDSGEKLSFDVTILLSLTVFMMIVAEAMPETSMAVPLIAKYFTCTMIMVAASVVLTIFTLNLHHRHPHFSMPMPNWVRVLCIVWIAWLVRMERPAKGGNKGDKYKDPKRRELELLERSPLRGKSHTQSYFPGNGIRTDPRNFYNSQDLIGIKYASYAEDEHDPMVIDQQMRQRKEGGGRLVSSECAAILDELRFLTDRFREEDAVNEVIEDWKFAAMVIDRCCLIFFTVFTTVTTIGILASAPNLGKDLL